MNNLGFLVVGVVQTDAQIGNSVLVPSSSSSSGILGLLPSTSPYDIIDDGPTWVSINGMKTPQVSLMDCPDSWWSGFHVWQCLYLVPSADLSCLQIGDVWWKHVRCNNLSFDLVHCGGIVFSLHLPSFGSSPKTIAHFRIFQAGCSWRFIQTVLQLPFNLCFSHSSRSS